MRKWVIAGGCLFCLATAAGGFSWLGERRVLLAAAMAALLAMAVLRSGAARRQTLVAACLVLGLLNGQRMIDPRDRLVVAEQQPAALVGIVVPGSWQNAGDGVRFTLETTGGRRGLVRVFWRNGTPQDERRLLGAHVMAQGVLRPMKYFHNPGLLDWEWRRWRQGEAGTLAIKAAPAILPGGEAPAWRAWLWERRQALKQEIARAMPPADAALLENMLFGGYGGLDPELVRDFTRTGLVHILSVSGSHVALLAAAGGWLCRQAGLAVRSSALLLGVLMWGYVFFCGLVVPAVRAALMGSLVLIGNLLGRGPDAVLGLTLLAAVFLGADPSLAVDVSFLLSFGSTAGLLLLAPAVAERLKAWPRLVSLPLAVAIGAQLAVLPLSLAFSHLLSLASLTANLLFTPLAEGAMVVALTGLLAPAGGRALLVLSSLLLGAANRGVAWLSGHPFAVLPLRHVPWWAVALYYAGLLAGFYALTAEQEPQRRKACQWGAGVCLGAWLFCLLPAIDSGFAVYFLDVGQGNAAVVLTPGGKTIVIDAGSREAGDIGRRVVSPVLSGFGRRTVDLLLLTHGHEDHAGGAVALAADKPIGEVWFPANDYAPLLERLLIEHPPQRVRPVRGGETLALDGVTVDVLQAGGADDGTGGNEHSAFYLISYKGHRFLFTGDAPAQQECAAVQRNLPVEVLQVAHHGSDTSSDAAFLSACQPAWAVISVGRDNRFGHPSPAALERLNKQGCRILRTDRQGAISFEEQGDRLLVKTWR